MTKTAHDFEALDIHENTISLKQYQGKVLLVVNTASQCGFTPQYEGLQNLYKKHSALEVLAFPCNQFKNQEPGDAKEIESFCQTRYSVTFPVFSKIEVNGSNAHPFFEFLKESLPGVMGLKKIKWNFTKFLIDQNGVPIKRYAPTTKPESMEADILKLIGKSL